MGGGSRRLPAALTGPLPALWWSRTWRPPPVHPLLSLPAALAGRCAPPVLVPRRHGQWHKSRASKAGTGLVIRCNTVLHAMYSRGCRRRPAAGMTARPCARSDWASRVLRGGQGGQAVALAGRHYASGTRRPQGARSGPLMVRRPRGSGRGLPVKGERRAVRGGGGVRCRPGGRGHGPPEWRCPAGPGGRVAPELCAAPEIPAQGGRGARPRAEPTPPPPGARSGPLGGGGGVGGRGRRGGGGAIS